MGGNRFDTVDSITLWIKLYGSDVALWWIQNHQHYKRMVKLISTYAADDTLARGAWYASGITGRACSGSRPCKRSPLCCWTSISNSWSMWFLPVIRANTVVTIIWVFVVLSGASSSAMRFSWLRFCSRIWLATPTGVGAGAGVCSNWVNLCPFATTTWVVLGVNLTLGLLNHRQQPLPFLLPTTQELSYLSGDNVRSLGSVSSNTNQTVIPAGA